MWSVQNPKDLGEDFERAFGQAVRAQRSQYRLSQKALSDALATRGVKIDPSAIARLEKGGQRGIRLGEAIALAQELDIDLTEMATEYDLPSSRFGLLRQEGDHYLNSVRQDLHQLASTFQSIAVLIDRTPELVDELGVPEVVDGQTYLQWVHGRIAELVEKPFVNFEFQNPYGSIIRKICAEAVRNMVVTKRELERMEAAERAEGNGEA